MSKHPQDVYDPEMMGGPHERRDMISQALACGKAIGNVECRARDLLYATPAGKQGPASILDRAYLYARNTIARCDDDQIRVIATEGLRHAVSDVLQIGWQPPKEG